MRLKPARHIAAAAVALTIGLPSSASADEPWALTEFVRGTTCAVLNLGYGPLKVIYAVLGTATGSAAWVLTAGDSQVSRRLIQPALRGDYAIVPEHLTAERPLEFFGRDPETTPRW